MASQLFQMLASVVELDFIQKWVIPTGEYVCPQQCHKIINQYGHYAVTTIHIIEISCYLLFSESDKWVQ